MAINFAVFEQMHWLLATSLSAPAYPIGSHRGRRLRHNHRVSSRFMLQMRHDHYASLGDAVKRIPVRHMYSGLLMSLSGFVPYIAIGFTCFHEFKRVLRTHDIQSKILAGGMSGVVPVSLTVACNCRDSTRPLQNTMVSANVF